MKKLSLNVLRALLPLGLLWLSWFEWCVIWGANLSATIEISAATMRMLLYLVIFGAAFILLYILRAIKRLSAAIHEFYMQGKKTKPPAHGRGREG